MKDNLDKRNRQNTTYKKINFKLILSLPTASEQSVEMGKCKNLRDFDPSQTVMSRRLIQSMSKSPGFVRWSEPTKSTYQPTKSAQRKNSHKRAGVRTHSSLVCICGCVA